MIVVVVFFIVVVMKQYFVFEFQVLSLCIVYLVIDRFTELIIEV